MRLFYSVTNRDGTRIDVDELVPFVYTPTRFGGRRQSLQCLKCGRRCRKIYGGRHFRCRQCRGLVHASTREPSYQRTLDRAERIRKRLGDTWGSAFDGDEFPPKPKRMRWATYRRLEAQYDNLQNCSAVGAMARLFDSDGVRCGCRRSGTNDIQSEVPHLCPIPWLANGT